MAGRVCPLFIPSKKHVNLDNCAEPTHPYTIPWSVNISTAISFPILIQYLDQSTSILLYHFPSLYNTLVRFSLQIIFHFSVLFAWMFDHNPWTPWPIYLKFWLGNSGEPRKVLFGFEILSWSCPLLQVKIAKIVIYDQVRVNGGSNLEHPRQR